MLLALFGVAVDTLHRIIPWEIPWTLIEDGAEMIVMSIIVWYVFDLELTPIKSESIHENANNMFYLIVSMLIAQVFIEIQKCPGYPTVFMYKVECY